jgi:hypothetical protein
MNKYKIEVYYKETIFYSRTVEVEADTQAEAKIKVKKDDVLGCSDKFEEESNGAEIITLKGVK